jgi:hypothetical protein
MWLLFVGDLWRMRRGVMEDALEEEVSDFFVERLWG